MIYRELCDITMASQKHLRSVLLVDSRAAAGAWSKGRSSSRNLPWLVNRRPKKTIHLVWVRSECNPADNPSRKRRMPEPPLNPSSVSVSAFGDQLEDYRKRRSNRDIWLQVNRPQACVAPGDTDSPHPSAQQGQPTSQRFSNRGEDSKCEKPFERMQREKAAKKGHLGGRG